MNHIKEIHIINTVWGKDFAIDFLDICLPTIFLSGNLPYLKTKIKIIYNIYTNHETKPIIENHVNFKKLCSLSDTKIIAYDFLLDLDKYDRMTQYYSLGYQEANKKNAGIITLTPDCILANNALKNLYHYICQNKRAVFVTGLPVLKSSIITVFKNNNLEKALLPHNLLKPILKNLHPYIRASMPNKKKIISWPSSMYWKITNKCLINKAFHMHPLFLWPENKKVLLVKGTYDREFPIKCCPDINTWKIIDDSNDILVVVLSEKNQRKSTYMKFSLDSISKWILHFNEYYSYNFYLFKHKICFHTQENISSVKENIIKFEPFINSLENYFFNKIKKKKSTFRLLYFFLFFLPPFFITFLFIVNSKILLLFKTNKLQKTILFILPPFVISLIKLVIKPFLSLKKSFKVSFDESNKALPNQKKLTTLILSFLIPTHFFIIYNFLRKKIN